MSAIGVADAAAWDRCVLDTGAGHLLQSATWGDLKARWGWRVHRLAWERDGRTVAAAQVLTRRLARSPFTMAYVPKGPLVTDVTDAARWGVVLDDLARWARGAGLTLLKIDPDVPAGADGVTAAWSARGWRPSDAPVQFPNTMTSDLSSGEEAVLGGMHAKTRYNIGLAERRGVVVRHAGEEGLGAFYDLYAATGRRAGFGVRSRDYYFDVWRTLLSVGLATVILAERDGRPLAGVIPVAYGDTAWYLYGASADAGREHMPAFLAQWESLRWAMGRGCRRYDWWGGPTVLDARDPLWGVYRFKRGFGALWVPQVGAWDLPVRRLRAALFTRLERWRRALLGIERAFR